ncbi:serine hydrolase domain-containing protein [Clostridium manihotivorum]|uniref:Serine hydrolase n=1 Tax=Clostridium manihotivorum TaxID=2320868 RepID=A0A410DZE6_9CLOT|nr:serine hydrolase domain-containing protein [Clostridium manihotivorum]QAA34437.1 serine hydrolase [Clostridium manihotivorum]
MNQFERLTPLLKSFVEKGPAGCSCSVSRNGEELYRNFEGFADLENKRPITEDTIFRIYSMTKVITCTAALILYERGLFLLNDPLEEYLPEFKNPQVHRYTPYGALSTSPASRPITIKDLFTMSSGLTYTGDNIETARCLSKTMDKLNAKYDEGKKFDVRTFSKEIAKVPLAFDPGSHWQYGYSHDVLGALIEVVSNKKFGQFLKDEIFDPLGMKDTFFSIPDEKLHRLSNIYDRSEDGTLTKNSNMDRDYRPDATFESGGAGLLSTLKDYSIFAQMLACGGELNGTRILSKKTIELMSTNHLTEAQLLDFDWSYQAGYGYGLGVRVMIDRAKGGSNSSLGEFGWCGMAGTWVMIDPKEKLSAVYMQQMFPNFEAYHQPRLRNVIYGSL